MKIEFAHKPIGELNGPWAFMLKASLAILPVFMTSSIAWTVWVTQRINALETNAAVVGKMTEQIAINTPKINTHEREIAMLQAKQVENYNADNAAHEYLRQKMLNEIGGVFSARFDEIKSQMTTMQKDILKVQLLLENRVAPLQPKRQQNDNS